MTVRPDASGADESSDTPNETPAVDNSVSEIKEELTRLRDQNSQLLGRLDQLSLSREPAPQPQSSKVKTPEEYKAWLAEDPASAIEYSIASEVEKRIKPIAQNLHQSNQKDKWDARAAEEFPAIKTDREFQSLVRDQMGELIATDGLSKDHPTLFFRAAQIAAAKYNKKTAAGNAGMSGEAPQGGEREPSKKFKKPNDFDAISSVFGISDDSKKRLAAKMEARHVSDNERKRR